MADLNKMHWIVYLISDVLSVTVLLTTAISRVPQIISIHQRKTVEGLSLRGLLVELTSYSITFLYNIVNGHALLSYAEYFILLFQEYILVGFVIYYSKMPIMYFLHIILSFGLVSILFIQGSLHKSILTFLMPFTTPMSVGSKLIMLFAIIKAQNADVVSLTTWAISIYTNAARIYTLLLDSQDIYLLVNFTLSTILATAVYVTAVYYKKIKRRND